jgi:hypothetical protein
MDKKIQPWLHLRAEKSPPEGWLKAIRGALGIRSRQLAQIVGIDSSAIIRLEEREPDGKMQSHLCDRPKHENESLEAIVDRRARYAARDLLQRVEHSMRLEEQGSPDSKAEIEKLAQKMKAKIDPRIWALTKDKKKKRTLASDQT